MFISHISIFFLLKFFNQCFISFSKLKKKIVLLLLCASFCEVRLRPPLIVIGSRVVTVPRLFKTWFSFYLTHFFLHHQCVHSSLMWGPIQQKFLFRAVPLMLLVFLSPHRSLKVLSFNQLNFFLFNLLQILVGAKIFISCCRPITVQ